MAQKEYGVSEEFFLFPLTMEISGFLCDSPAYTGYFTVQSVYRISRLKFSAMMSGRLCFILFLHWIFQASSAMVRITMIWFTVCFAVCRFCLAETTSDGEERSGRVKRQVALTPTCGQSLYTGIVNENSAPGTQVLQATASSPVGNQLVWSIQDTTFQRFSINPTTGAVSVAGSLTRAAMQRSALEFRIRATDGQNQLYCESTVRVNVLPSSGTSPIVSPGTGSQPYFSQTSYSFSVPSATFGTPVGQVSASGTGGVPTYTISGTSYFTINPQTGQITANANLGPGSYTFTVTAQTPYGAASSTVTVQGTGSGLPSGGTPGTAAPTFSQSTYTVSASSCTQGSPVVQVQAGGGSPAAPTSYYVAGTFQFVMNPSTGLLTLAQNVSPGTYSFQIIAQNAYGRAGAYVTVNVSCGQTPTSPAGSTSYYFSTGTCPAGTQLGAICANSFG